MALKEDFEKASVDVQNLKKRPDTSTLLELYALFKQAKEGDVRGTRPGMLDFAGRSKYDAWAKKKSIPSEKAMQDYIDLVQKLQKAD